MSPRQRWLRAAGNMLLGVSVGLLAYYGATTLVSAAARQRLSDDVSAVSAFTADEPRVMTLTEGSAFDLDGWDAEDAAYWSTQTAGAVFARISIPAIELDLLVVNGVRPADLRAGPGWIDWTDLPGPTGTCGISGHRTTYGAPFFRIDELAPGDIIDLYSPYRRYRYHVTESLVVTPDQVEVVAPTEEPSLTLTACHPPYSAQYRLAVRARLVEVLRIENQEQ